MRIKHEFNPNLEAVITVQNGVVAAKGNLAPLVLNYLSNTPGMDGHLVDVGHTSELAVRLALEYNNKYPWVLSNTGSAELLPLSIEAVP